MEIAKDNRKGILYLALDVEDIMVPKHSWLKSFKVERTLGSLRTIHWKLPYLGTYRVPVATQRPSKGTYFLQFTSWLRYICGLNTKWSSASGGADLVFAYLPYWTRVKESASY